MEFPSYVPHAVRVSMAARLEGARIEPSGWILALASAEAELLRVQQMQQDYRHDEAVSNALRIEFAKATEHRDLLAAEVACCQRLVHDARMQPAYALLVSLPNVTDAHLSGFIYAAWAARMDYAKRRAQVKAADELAGAVAKAAGALAELLHKAEGFVGPCLPSEFFSIRRLLEKTEHDRSDRDFYLWPGMRDYILGESEPAQVEPREPGEMPEAPEIVQIEPIPLTKAEPPDPDEERRDMLRYAWGTAPSVGRIIATMQQEALNYTAAESGHIAAALASRQHSGKTAYLRAFGALLRGEHSIVWTTGAMNAMATTATVVLNEPDLVVTYDDVKKALATIAS